MMNKKIQIGMILLIGIVFGLIFVSATYTSSNPKYTQFSQRTSIDKAQCEEGMDFVIQISPFGCTPAVVRTDLLEENDVNVFCELGATQINPLLDVEAIDSMSFDKEGLSKLVKDIGFHPAKSALGVKTELNSPVLNNIGYVVITLKKQANESSIPDFVTGNLTAKVKYDVRNALGVGRALFYLPELDQAEWEEKKSSYGFWNGRGYLKADGITSTDATISVYNTNTQLASVNLEKGEKSQKISIPGFECTANLELKLEGLESPVKRAQLRINSEVVEVANEERFLDNKCQVRSLDNAGIVKKISIKCQEDSGADTFDLRISPNITFRIGGVERTAQVGDFLYDNEKGDKGVYLGYIDSTGNPSNPENLLVYLVAIPKEKFDETRLTDDELVSLNFLGTLDKKEVSTSVLDKTAAAVKEVAGEYLAFERYLIGGKEIHSLLYSRVDVSIFGKQVSLTGFAEPVDLEIPDDAKEYYDNAKSDYETIRDSFSSEAYDGTSFGEEALYNEIVLLYDAGQKRSVLDLCTKFEGDYPNSEKKLDEYCKDKYKLSSQDNAIQQVTINKVNKKIIFDDVYEPSFDDYGVRVRVDTDTGSEYYDLKINEIKYLDIISKDFIELVSIDDNSARIRTSLSASGVMEAIEKEFSSETIRLEKDVTRVFEDYSFTATEINLKKVAKVSVIPGYESAGTQAKFGFKIGIEKRNFKLSPEKTKEKIENLNKDISKWQNISNNLGNVTDGLKKACIATGLGLALKNFLANTGGAGIARQYVMRGKGGWVQKCAGLVTDTYTQEKCYLDNADEINKEVEELSKIIEEQNKNIKELEKDFTTQEFLSDKVVDTNKFMEKYVPKVQDCLKGLSDSSITDPSGKGEAIDVTAILNDLEYADWKVGKYTKEQLRDIELFCLSKKVSALSNFSDIGLYSNLLDIKTASAESNERASSLSKYGFKEGYFGSSSDKIKEIPISNVQTFSEVRNNFKGMTNMVEDDAYVYYFRDKFDRKEYLLVLDNDYFVAETYSITDAGLVVAKEGATNPFFFGFKKYDASKYENKYTNAKLRYYETEPYKGMPAVVPFDLENGWYAYIEQTLPVLGSIRAYDASARLNSFWVCNVGENGLGEDKAPDDICELINTDTGQPYDVFHGLSETDAKEVIDKADEAVRQAQAAYKSGLSGKVSILNEQIEVGSPAVDISQFSCQDFMSPEDCLLLFNVCDPVICPSSRCNLGGTFAVQDVIQSGIIGSIVLCLPNAQDGIIVPVCLSGIKAGLDGLLSVLTATKDCMQESLDTGKMVGICDEIYSVYMCEFLWRQALPVADVIIPKVIEMMLGQNVRGGGEYLGVSNAWNVAEKSINYFTQYYAASATKAFKARTTEEAGTELCRLSVSGVVPDSGNLLDTLTRTDSPPQFHGRFDEIPFTSVTVPPVSQYKVYYHIFAGKDSGVYYQVFLKGSAGSSYYQDTSNNLIVASGYAGIGGYASETKDFTAPSGYKEMCISVNGQEECGFKEVTTSFAVDYLGDMYAQEQINQTDIQTERECIAGSPSIYSLANLNVQSAAEGLANPAIYNQGIIRICATKDPGVGTDAYAGMTNSRWKEVGYCDDSNIKCWLDTQSVKDAVQSTAIEGQVLGEINKDYLAVLKNQYGYLSEEDFASKVAEIEDESEPTKKIGLVEDIIGKVFHNSEKARLFLLRGEAYSILMERLLIKIASGRVLGTPGGVSTVPTTEPRSIGAKRLWEAAKQFADDGFDEYRILNGQQQFTDVCTRFVMRCMDRAGIKIEGVVLRNTWTEEENMDKLAERLRESAKFLLITNPQNLKQGDIVMIGNGNEKTQHTGIFDSYSLDRKRIFYYDDAGVGKNGEKIRVKKSEVTITGTWYFTKAYRYIGDLTEEQVALEKKEAETGAIGGVTEEIEISKMQSNIWAIAKDYLRANNDESKVVRGGEKECITFVTRCLDKAGIDRDYFSSTKGSIYSFMIGLIGDTDNFMEVSPSALAKGDIVIMGLYCEMTQMMGIVDEVKEDKISFYYNSKGGATNLAKDIPITSDNWYVYRAFRYIEDLSASQKTNALRTQGISRKSWTIDEAIEWIDDLKLSGGYLEPTNKQFVDQLVFNGLITKDECMDMRGMKNFVSRPVTGWTIPKEDCQDMGKVTFGITNLFRDDKDMKWVRNLLVQKKLATITTYKLYQGFFSTSLIANVYFRYMDEWLWSPDRINWMTTAELTVKKGAYKNLKPNKEGQELITSLAGKNLGEGEDLLFPTKSDKTIYEVKVIKSYFLVSPLYFAYENEWLWSPNQKDWMTSKETVAKGGFWSMYAGQKPTKENQDLIEFLLDKTFEQGRLTLISLDANQITAKESIVSGGAHGTTSPADSKEEKIGFKIGSTTTYDEDVIKTGEVELVVSEGNCDEVEYQIWKDDLSDFTLIGDQRIFYDEKMNLEKVNTILNVLPKGKYHVTFYCLKEGKRIGEPITSKNLEITSCENCAQRLCEDCGLCTQKKCEEISNELGNFELRCEFFSPSSNPCRTRIETETTPTTTPTATREEKIGFKIGNVITYTVDVAKTGAAEIIVEFLYDCSTNRYEIWKNAFFDTKVASRTNLIDLTNILNSITGEGKYHIDAYCLDANGKTMSHLKSKDLVISHS